MWNPQDKQVVIICCICGGPAITTQAVLNKYGSNYGKHDDINVCNAVKRNQKPKN